MTTKTAGLAGPELTDFQRRNLQDWRAQHGARGVASDQEHAAYVRKQRADYARHLRAVRMGGGR